jgi:hypothetical protein
MRKGVFIWIIMLILAFWVGFALAQELIVFPAKGQSQEQMEKDKFECYGWAKQQTGFDPIQSQPSAQAAPAQSQSPQGERIKGAARGAAVGAVVGKIANDDAGKGAAAGAAGGAMVGGMKSRDQKRQQQAAQQQQAQQQEAAVAQNRSAYDRAYSACMEGKGYTVK